MPPFPAGTNTATSTTLPVLQSLQELGQSVILKFYLGFSNANILLCCGNIIHKVYIRQNAHQWLISIQRCLYLEEGQERSLRLPR